MSLYLRIKKTKSNFWKIKLQSRIECYNKLRIQGACLALNSNKKHLAVAVVDLIWKCYRLVSQTARATQISRKYPIKRWTRLWESGVPIWLAARNSFWIPTSSTHNKSSSIPTLDTRARRICQKRMSMRKISYNSFQEKPNLQTIMVEHKEELELIVATPFHIRLIETAGPRSWQSP